MYHSTICILIALYRKKYFAKVFLIRLFLNESKKW